MIGEQFSIHFLVFRYLMIGVAGVGLWMAFRFRSVRPALVTLILLGALSWLLTWLPLARPYGLESGSRSTFELGVVAAGAANDTPLEGWLVGRRNPRPAWSGIWYVLARGNPERARRFYSVVPLVTLVVLPLVLYLLFRHPGREGGWEALSVAFSATYAASVALDAYRPFGLFHRSFFVTPHRSFALMILLVALAGVWKGGWRRKVAAGLLLGLVAWIDLTVFAWGLLAFVAWDVVKMSRKADPVGEAAWPATLMSCVLAAPQVVRLFRSELLLRGWTPEEAEGYRIASRDLFAATTDMSWIFVLAILAVPVLWKRGRASDIGILSIFMGGFALWLVGAVAVQAGPFLELDAVFHLLRFGCALTAGVGGYFVGTSLLGLVGSRKPVSPVLAKAQSWVSRAPRSPLAFVLLVLFLLPQTSVFLWHPLRMDPLYYPSLRPVDAHVDRLGQWILENTRPGDKVLSSAGTSEWVASLTGRRVLMAVRVLPREERRSRQREMRALFLSGDPARMSVAVRRLGASVLVFDQPLRELYWQLDPAFLESSGVFRKEQQIGEQFAVYRAH